ncbi:MAG: serine hydroxymethyltransferase [Candidatus Micrarchaeia archaeon]
MAEEKRVLELTRQNDAWRASCINLIASENVMSPLAKRAYMSDFMHRYAEGFPFKRYYQGTKFIDEIEDWATRESCAYFGAKQADVRPISGALANTAVFAALAKPGELLMNPGTSAGAHISHQAFGSAGICGLRVEHYVFDMERYDIDVDATRKKILELKPKIVTFGGSVIPFRHPCRELADDAKSVGARVVYDAAHVLGLIGGGAFQHPFSEGAEIITSSTHKTFPGPQGGLILGNTDEETFKQIQRKVFPGLVSNHHLHRLPAYLITLFEMKKWGKEYAAQTVRNARAFGAALAEQGFRMIGEDRGYSESHQVLSDVRELGSSTEIVQALERANIICNKNLLAWDEPRKSMDPSGIRWGVQEMTRFGMREKDMAYIAELVARVVIKKEKPEKVRRDVVAFRRKFRKVRFGFG